MEYQAFVARAREAAALAGSRDFVEASRVFKELAEQDLPTLDRATMYRNAAITMAGTDQESETEKLYDAGIALERPMFRGEVRASKADWLWKQGRAKEAGLVYANLLEEQWLTAGERRQYENLLFKTRA